MEPTYTYRPILHVESDENDVLLLNRAMGIADIAHPVHVARTVEQAVNYLLGLPPYHDRQLYPLPSLVLLDWNATHFNGLEFLEWRRSQSTIKRIPVIVLTLSQLTADVAAAYEAGANGYLAKPVTFGGLVEMAKAIRAYWLTQNRYAPLPDEPDIAGIEAISASIPVASPSVCGEIAVAHCAR